MASLLQTVNRMAADFARMFKDEKAPKAKVDFSGLDILIQKSADAELAKLWTQARATLRTDLDKAVAKTAPGALDAVSDELAVVVYVAMQDPTLLAELNRKARQAGLKDAIAYLRAALAAERQAE